MDGESTSRKILVSQNIIWPNGLTIDYSEDRIWWTDARFGMIESVDLNGGDRKVALRSSRARYTFGISLFQDSIFVAKRQGGRKILKVDKSGGKRSVTLLRYLYGPRGIVVYHPSRQPGTGQNCVLSMCLNMTEWLLVQTFARYAVYFLSFFTFSFPFVSIILVFFGPLNLFIQSVIHSFTYPSNPHFIH